MMRLGGVIIRTPSRRGACLYRFSATIYASGFICLPLDGLKNLWVVGEPMSQYFFRDLPPIMERSPRGCCLTIQRKFKSSRAGFVRSFGWHLTFKIYREKVRIGQIFCLLLPTFIRLKARDGAKMLMSSYPRGREYKALLNVCSVKYCPACS